MPSDKAKLENKGYMFIHDEILKKFVPVAVVDSIRISHPASSIDIKTPSGIQILKTADLGASISGDLYHPGDLTLIEQMFRGVVELEEFDGSTAVAGEEIRVKFRVAGSSFVLPGYDGDRSAVTVNSVKSVDGATTYTATTHYTVTADPETGMTLINHVAAGTIPVDTEVVVDYDYTPLEGKRLQPDHEGTLFPRDILIDSYVDCTNHDTKYRRYYLPRATISTELVHALLKPTDANANVGIMPFTFDYARPDDCESHPVWAWWDFVNV